MRHFGAIRVGYVAGSSATLSVLRRSPRAVGHPDNRSRGGTSVHALVPQTAVLVVDLRLEIISAPVSARQTQCLLTASVELLPLRLAWRTELESLHHKRVVVLFLALLVGPDVGSHPGLYDQLVSFLRMPCDGLASRTEGREPHARDHFARHALVIFSTVVITDQAEAGAGHIALRDDFRAPGQVTNRRQSETIHRKSSATLASMLVSVNRLENSLRRIAQKG